MGEFVSHHLSWWAVVAILAVLGLVVILWYERRQARHIEERTRELEHLSAELIRVNRLKSEFLANMSHELRTPLNAIVGFVDLLREGVYGELTPRQAVPVKRIEASANHLRHLVDQILDLARMAAARVEVHAEWIELRPFLLGIASEVEPLAAEKSLALTLALGSSARVYTDPIHLRQVMMNLLGNAVKYTAEGSITVRTRVAQGRDVKRVIGRPVDVLIPEGSTAEWVVVQVVDTGIGVADKDQARIFDEFEQVNAGPRGDSMSRGTGLGLPISRRLARLLGGEITLESHLGKGSIFTLWLPVSAEKMERTTMESSR